jgi:putative FmdB family regulatory protein
MPIYEYQCGECGHAFDALQKMSDAVLTDCPDCKQPALRKLVSAPNFRLKGAGWYETDFKDKNKRNLAGDAGKAPDAKSKPAAGADKKSNSSDASSSSNSGSKSSSNSGSKSAE